MDTGRAASDAHWAARPRLDRAVARQRREELGWSIGQLARASGVEASMIARFEAGATLLPHTEEAFIWDALLEGGPRPVPGTLFAAADAAWRTWSEDGWRLHHGTRHRGGCIACAFLDAEEARTGRPVPARDPRRTSPDA